MYAKVNDGAVVKFPYTAEDLQRDYPGTTISNMSPDVLKHLSMVQVVVTGAAYDPVSQVAEQNGCVYNEERNRWETAWSVRRKTTEELAQDYEEKAAQVRAARNNKLSRCDWTQVLDAQVDRTAWATYRQELRDITAQSGFPFNVVWPQEP